MGLKGPWSWSTDFYQKSSNQHHNLAINLNVFASLITNFKNPFLLIFIIVTTWVVQLQIAYPLYPRTLKIGAQRFEVFFK